MWNCIDICDLKVKWALTGKSRNSDYTNIGKASYCIALEFHIKNENVYLLNQQKPTFYI